MGATVTVTTTPVLAGTGNAPSTQPPPPHPSPPPPRPSPPPTLPLHARPTHLRNHHAPAIAQDKVSVHTETTWTFGQLSLPGF